MKLPRRQFLHLAAGAAAFPALPRIARAQAYPTRPITMVLPFPVGGPTDAIARIIAERMRVSLGQPLIVEVVAGANGSIGLGKVARAAPDGYTMVIGQFGTHVVNGAIYSLPYDLQKDFEPIAALASNPELILARNSLPASDLKGLIAWLAANPDKASQGTGGVGSPSHIAGILFQKQTGARYQFVPYRGSAPAIQDLMAGQIDMFFDSPTSALPQVRAGLIRVYAVTALKRLLSAPDIPTADEAGLPGFVASNWHGLWAPKGIPGNVLHRLNVAVVDSLADPAVRSRLANLGQEIFPREQQTPEALAIFQSVEIEKWWPIIKAAGIKAE